MRSGLLVVLVVATAFVGACTDANGGDQAPTVSGISGAELRAQAIWAACVEVVCPGAPMLVDASTPGDVRTELATFTDEIRYVTTSEAEAMAPFGERFPDGATLFESRPPQPTAKSTVVGVDVLIYRGPGDLIGRTYLFQWDGSQWNQTSPDAVGVTVTSAVS